MLQLLALAVTGALVVQQLYIVVYNLYFHPLVSFPGPKLWIAFPVLRYIAQCRGTFDQLMVQYHRYYGEVVRFDNDTLSFTTAQAWKDIYGYGHGQNQWPKQNFGRAKAVDHIISANDVDHARYRRSLSHAFSEQALRLQEDLIKGYVDMLIDSLREEAENDRNVDMTMWYNLTTFDIISDLAFGEPSNCLQTGEYGEFIPKMFKFVRIVPFVQLAKFHPLVWQAISLFLGRRVNNAREGLVKIGRDTAMKRKNDASKNGRGDFMESMLKYSDNKEPITDAELAGNAHILFLAGSETSATLLAGVTYWMLRTPKALQKAVQEVRSAFDREDDITFSSASAKLPYTLACLEEGLRMYPPVPTVLIRTTTEAATVSGYPVPKGTNLGVHQMSANRSPANFSQAAAFHPERWLPSALSNASSPFRDDNRDARQPFSLGPRNCIGKNLAFSEMRQILARVLWNFDLELVDGEFDWSNQKSFTLWQKGPLVCRISLRKDRQ